MALSVSQIAAASYPAVVANKRKPENQWAENAALRVLEKMGFIQHLSLGENIEVPLDYRSNPDTAVLAYDQDEASLLNTEVITSAVFDIAQLNVPVKWTMAEEVKNPSESQKIDLIASKIDNGLTSHDDLIEQCIFTTSTAGGAVELTGLADLISTAGTGTVGGIDASLETFWANQADTFVDATDMEAAMTEVYNDCSKGSGSAISPTLLISNADLHALYESQLQTLQRFVDTNEADAGFKVLAFKGAKYVFSHRGSARVYFLNPKNYNLVVSKQAFRLKGDTWDIPGQNAFYFMIYSALQFIVNNRSRLGVLSQS